MYLIPKKAIYDNGFFKTILGDINTNDNNLCYQKVTLDSRLNYDKKKICNFNSKITCY